MIRYMKKEKRSGVCERSGGSVDAKLIYPSTVDEGKQCRGIHMKMKNQYKTSYKQ